MKETKIKSFKWLTARENRLAHFLIRGKPCFLASFDGYLYLEEEKGNQLLNGKEINLDNHRQTED